MPVPAALASLRHEIDVLDRELLGLLERRRAVVHRIAALKHRAHLPAVDPQREAQMADDMVRAGGALGLPEKLVRGVLEAILQDSRALVERERG